MVVSQRWRFFLQGIRSSILRFEEHSVSTEYLYLYPQKTKQCLMCRQNAHMFSHQKLTNAFCADRMFTLIDFEKVV